MKLKRLTVLQVATINKPIKPDLGYGPIETVICDIDKGLRSLGHRSIVACSADSCVTGEQHVTVQRSLGDYVRESTPEQKKIVRMHLSKALERAKMDDIDIIHMHAWLEYIYGGVFSPLLPIVMTLHVPAKDSWIKKDHCHRLNTMQNPSVHFVAISEYQKQQYNGLANITTIHHGIEMRDWHFKDKPVKGSYLFTIGRITPAKGQDKAIEVAKKTGFKLIIAGYVQNKPADQAFFKRLKGSIDLFVDTGKHHVDKDYYEKVMKPLLDCDKQIIYIGEISREQKEQWYRHARATLFPIRWGEPFGLILIESMACGTPILAFREGAVPEIVVDGKTGFVVKSLDGMIGAVDRIDCIDPCECQRHVQNCFSITSMAKKYSELYQQILDEHETPLSVHVHPEMADYQPTIF
ncbi:MAG: glycosyltransferase family 4 protein [Deltaproteobacteria bacterium]|nr:glycosyltransferase family 4 protein [Deltaproteobacteria bacterium]MBW2073960.1 glycosyltransferase family 4 protein [Deltaproteobacteria bacterium]